MAVDSECFVEGNGLRIRVHPPDASPTLKDRAEHAVMRHRAGCVSPVLFRKIQKNRRELGLDDWSGDVQMVQEALEGLARHYAEREQLRLPETC